MPEAPPHPPAPAPSRGRGGGGDLGASLSRKLGPLPLYAWVVVVVAAYFLWRHFRGGSSGALGGSAANAQGLGASTYVPTGDQSGGGGTGVAGGAGTGTDLTPVTVQSSTDATQASGGGTASSSATSTTAAAPAYSRPVYLGPATTSVAAAMQQQVSVAPSGRPTKVGGLYHPGQGFE